MKTNHISSASDMNQWEKILTIVTEHNTVVQPDFSKQYTRLSISRLLSENILTFLLQFIGLMFADAPTAYHISPVWFASGTACAFIFLRGYTVLPGILSGSVIAYYLLTFNIYQSVFSAALASIQAFLLLWICHRYISPTLVFFDKKKFIQFILYSSTLTAVTSFIYELIYLSTFPPDTALLPLGLRWWLGNFSGILIFALAILTWDLYFMQMNQLKKMNKLMLAVYYGLLFADIILLLFSQNPIHIIITTLLTLPLIGIISLELRWCGVIAAIFLFGLLLNLSAYLFMPVFTSNIALLTSAYIQSVLVIEAILGLFIAIKDE